MKVFCWNVNGLTPTFKNIVHKYKSLKGFFEQYGADIACFQEAKIPEPKLTKEIVSVDDYESFWSISR